MVKPVVLTPEDKTIVDRFYDRISAAAMPSSASKQTIVRAELEGANALLRPASDVAQQVAWADVLDLYSKDMDPGFVADLKGERAAVWDKRTLYRARNGYIASQRSAPVPMGALIPELKQKYELDVRRQAVRDAIERQMPLPDATRTDKKDARLAQQELMRLLDSCDRPDDVRLIRHGWLMVAKALPDGKLEADLRGVRALEAALGTWQANGGTELGELETLLQPVEKIMHDRDASADATTTVNGMHYAEIAKELDALMHAMGTGKLLLNENKIRVDEYNQTVKRIFDSKLVQKVLPRVTELMAKDDEESQVLQSLAGNVVINKEQMALAKTTAFGQALYESTQKIGRDLGFTSEVTLVIAPGVLPNAFIFTADLDHPRVTFFKPMVMNYWDSDKQDWIKLWLDKDRRPVMPGTEGAVEVPVGKLIVESVIAHELGHIRDQVVKTHSVLFYLFFAFGRNLLDVTSQPEDRARIQKFMQEAARSLENCFGSQIKDNADRLLKPLMTDSKLRISPADARSFMHLLSSTVLEAGEDSLESLAAAMPGAAALLGPAAASAHSCGGSSGITMEDLFRFIIAFLKMNRAAEASADRYAVVAQGTTVWTSLCDMGFALNLDTAPTTAEKKDAITRLMQFGPEKYATTLLHAAEKVKDLQQLDEENYRTHPSLALRIAMQTFFDADEKGFATRLRAYKDLTPDQQLLAVIQLYEEECDGYDKKLKDLKPQNVYDMLPSQHKRAQHLAALAESEKKLHHFLDLSDRLTDRGKGLARADNAFVTSSIKFIQGKGLELASEAPFKRLVKHWHGQLNAFLSGANGKVSGVERSTGQRRLKELETLLNKYDPDYFRAKAEKAAHHAHPAAPPPPPVKALEDGELLEEFSEARTEHTSRNLAAMAL